MIVILNASAGAMHSGSSPVQPDDIRRLFEARGITPDVRLSPMKDLPAALEQALREAPEALVVGGGDGTLSTAAQALAGRSIPLGLLPLGTLNHFCKDLGIGDDLPQAVSIIADGSVRSVDLGMVNGRVFINNCSLGAYPKAVRRREELRRLKGYRKWTAMITAAWEVLLRLERMRAHLSIDGQDRARRTPLVFVSNNPYTGGLLSQNWRDRVDRGELWVYTVRTHRVLPLLRLALMAVANRLSEADEFESWPARNVTVTLPGSRVLGAVDGEVLSLDVPLRFTIRPGALRVFAPRIRPAP